MKRLKYKSVLYEQLRLVENNPLNTEALARMIADPEDLHLVWPVAEYPFNHDQWRAELDPANGTRSFLVYEGERMVGHGALAPCRGDEDSVMVRFLYIAPDMRNRGAGRRLLSLLEARAKDAMGARRLILKVRTYNQRAMGCYGKYGFREYSRDGTLVLMEKNVL